MGNKEHENDVRIRMYEVHMVWLNPNYIKALEPYVKTSNYKDVPAFMRAFIKSACMQDFGLELRSAADIYNLEDILIVTLFQDKADWIRDKLRHFLEEKQNNEKSE